MPRFGMDLCAKSGSGDTLQMYTDKFRSDANKMSTAHSVLIFHNEDARCAFPLVQLANERSGLSI